MFKTVIVFAFTVQGMQTGEKIAAAAEALGSRVEAYAPERFLPEAGRAFPT